MRVNGVELRMLSLHLRHPHVGAADDETERPAVVVRLLTDDGEGWGECTALRAPTYAPEYAWGAWEVLRSHLVPRLLTGPGAAIAPDEVRGMLAGVRGHHMAKAALEMAVLDASLRAAGRSLATWLGVEAASVPAGAVAGLASSPAELVERVGALVEAGYVRVKLKIAPGADVVPVAAVRDRFPDLVLQVDANGAYRLEDAGVLAGLDDLGLACLEQPLPADDLTGHAALAAKIRTRVCLDESITSLGRLEAALGLGACRVVCVKAGPLGGPLRAVEAHDACRRRGVDAWCGGMLETGLGRAANAALAGLPGFTLVGDVSGGPRFLEDDPFGTPTMDRGRVALHQDPGVGPDPDRDALASVTSAVELVRAPGRPGRPARPGRPGRPGRP
jgi:O-succinylbenzoate synthase